MAGKSKVLALCPHMEVFMDEVIKWMWKTAEGGSSLLPGPIRAVYRQQVFQGESLANQPGILTILELAEVLDLNQFFPFAKALMTEGKPFGTRTDGGGEWAWSLTPDLVPILPKYAISAAAIIDEIAWAARRDVFSHVFGMQFPPYQEVKSGDSTLLVLIDASADVAQPYDLTDSRMNSRQLMEERIRRVHLGEIPPFVIEIKTISGPVTLRFASLAR